MDSITQRTHPFQYWLLLVVAAGILCIFVPKLWIAAAMAGLVAGAIVLYTAAEAIHGRVDWPVMGWVLIFPLGYYFLTFPKERPVFTLDRAIVGLVFVAIAFRAGRLTTPLPQGIKQAGIAWSLFLAGVLISLRHVDNPLGKTKELLDTFAFPGVLAWYVIRNFNLRQNLSKLHVLACLMAIYVAGIGLIELRTGQDLLPASAGVFIVEETGLNRVNGPFATNNSFGLIGLVSLLFVVFLRRAMGHRMPAWQRLLHSVGVFCALAIAVMPLFRSILITLALIVLLEFFKARKPSTRVFAVAAVLLGMSGLLWFKKLAPDMFDYRVSDPSDVYARIAQQKQTLEMFLANPMSGVGWGNYIDAAYSFSDASYKGVYSVGSAHNTLGALLAETGILGVVPFIAAQFLLFRFFWRLRRSGTHDARLASNFLVYVFLAYWITGVSLTSGYYSDINMWYLFVLAVLCKFALTELPNPGLASRVQHSAVGFPNSPQTVLVARV